MDKWDTKAVGEGKAETITAWNLDLKSGDPEETRILKRMRRA